MERDYWLAFALSPGIGPVKFNKLVSEFGSAQEAWEAPQAKIVRCIGPKTAEHFFSFKEAFSLTTYLCQLQEKNVWVLPRFDTAYPQQLLKIADAPFVLFGRGNMDLLQSDSLAVGVVGTRKVTEYGRQVTEMLTKGLVDAGCVIVSGLALGVDAIAHTIAVENKGKTIAVLGCGVDVCYPASNKHIYNKITRGEGTIISEFPLGMSPTVGSFPSRNRIIAGISQAVIVTEGAEDSGSLITAENALELGRKVFAVPGPITSTLSKGPLSLLRKGAVLVTSVDDILSELGKSKKRMATPLKGDSKTEQQIIDILQGQSQHFDQLVKGLHIEASALGGILSLMEIKGMIHRSATGSISLVVS